MCRRSEHYFEIILDSHIIIGNNTESPYTLHPGSPSDNILHSYNDTVVQYHNQDIDIDIIPQSYFNSSVFHGLICMFLCVFSSIQFYYMCRFVLSHHGQGTEQFYLKDPLC